LGIILASDMPGIDYILSGSDIYFLEVNSIPGMSEASIIPKMAQAFGLTLERFFDMVLEEALRKN
jgi:D-alanine-D-alanine ligase